MPWKIDTNGKRTLVTTLGLRQRTRKLRQKANRAVATADRSRVADLPLAGRQSAGANGGGEFFPHQEGTDSDG